MLARLIWKNIVQRPLRYVLTGIAIAFGVAAVSAVFIFTDGLRATFDELANDIESGYDISVRPRIEFGGDSLAPTVPLDHLGLLETIEGVDIVQPRVVGLGVIAVDDAGEPTLARAGPNLGVHWGTRNPNTRLFLQSGRRPESANEFALDIDSFDAGDYIIGNEYVVQVPAELAPGTKFTLVGTFTFADPDQNALVGARLVAFDEDTAVELINQGSGYSDITLLVDADANPDAIIERIEMVVDDKLEVLTREQVLEETQGDFGQILDVFRTVLLVFAVIILLVSSFLIYNVFSITLGQRIRELGLLRAIGALGTQVTQLMIGEALLLGIIATIVGIPSGVGLAWLLRTALKALGFPDDTGLPVTAWTILWAILTGVVVTLLAAIWPSVQARRVSPMAALRDGANLSDLAAVRNVPAGLFAIGVGIAGIGLAFTLDGWAPRLLLPIVSGLFVYLGTLMIDRRVSRFVLLPIGAILLGFTLIGDYSLGETFGLLGAGALLLLLGSNQLNPFVARPAVKLLGHTPTALVLGLLGILLAAASIGLLVFGLVVAFGGVPDSLADRAAESSIDLKRAMVSIPAVALGAFAALVAFGIVRTALGSLGLTGRVARANAARNPQRTATTAAALMIGLTLVTAVTIIGDSIKSSVSDALSSSIKADWLLQSPVAGPTRVPFSAAAAERIEALPEIESVVSYRAAFPAAWATSEKGALDAADFQQFLPIILELINPDEELNAQDLIELRDQLGTDIEINDAIAVDFSSLDDHVDPVFIEQDPSITGPTAVYVLDDFAAEKALAVGDSFPALFVDLQSEDLVVAGIYTNGFVLGGRVMTIEMWNRHFPTNTDQFLTAITADGVAPDDARKALTDALAEDFPIIEVLDKSEFAEQAERQINQTLATVNVLLGLSAVIAALGILVALALSVFERTREIGLFRAVGTTRHQTRWMIRWEGVIVAAFGGLMGVLIGIVLGILATIKMPEFLVTTTTIPFPTLIGYIVFASLVGLAAAVFPAWIAGRMDVLESIGTE